MVWSEVASLCGFWDGSCERGTCGAGMLIRVFTQAFGWVTIHKKCGLVSSGRRPPAISCVCGRPRCIKKRFELSGWFSLCCFWHWKGSVHRHLIRFNAIFQPQDPTAFLPIVEVPALAAKTIAASVFHAFADSRAHIQRAVTQRIDSDRSGM